MPEDVAKHSTLPNFTTSTTGTMMEVLDNYITFRDKMPLNGLGTAKFKAGGLSMIMKTV